MLDALGVGDRDWSAQLGRASITLLLRIAATELAAGRSVVMEANLSPELAEPELAAMPPHRIVQVHCDGDPDELVARFAARPGRHSGHLDDQPEALEQAERAIRDRRHEPLDVDGPLVRFTIGDDVVALVDAVRQAV